MLSILIYLDFQTPFPQILLVRFFLIQPHQKYQKLTLIEKEWIRKPSVLILCQVSDRPDFSKKKLLI